MVRFARFSRAIASIGYWLECHVNFVPHEGATVSITLPTEREVREATTELRRELAPHLVASEPESLPAGIAAKIHGVNVRFVALTPRS
jgi:hypothetical protein